MKGPTLRKTNQVRRTVVRFRSRVLGLVSRALVASSCCGVQTTQVDVQSDGDRSSRVREYTCDRSR